MNSDPKTSPSPINSDSKAETAKGLDLSVTQIVGGALAAMTAAALGSRLSVAGTVIGAAVASIIAGVAGALYTASLRHTRDRVRSVWTGKSGATPARVEWLAQEPAATDAAAAPPAPAVARPAGPSASRRSGVIWRRIAVGAIATFAVTAGALTGFELLSGQALSGGSGTTFSQVSEPEPGPAVSTPEPSDTPSADPSGSPSPEASTASPTPEPSTEPSIVASPEPTPVPSSDPSVTPGSGSSEVPSSAASTPAEPSDAARATVPNPDPNQPTTDPGTG